MDVADLLRQGTEHHQRGRYAEAERCYRKVLELQPSSAEAWHLLGLIAQEAGQLAVADEHIRRALTLSPNRPEFLNSLALVHMAGWDMEQARECLETALRRQPTHAGAQNNLGEVYKAQGDVRRAVEHYRASLRCRPDPAVHSNLLLTLLYDPEPTLEALGTEHRDWDHRYGHPAGQRRQHANDPDPHRPLRIGYVSPDFRRHVTFRFFAPVLARHDRRQFQVFLYGEVAQPDPATAHLQSLAAGYRSTVGRPAAEVAAQIEADGIDLLIDLAGHTAHNRLDVFALKPAPIQLTYLDYPHTTGLKAIDYRITDAIIDPPDRPFGGPEKLIRLPSCFFCYQFPEAAPPVGPLPARTNGFITFAAPHQVFKLNEPLLELWRRVLEAVPGSRLAFLRSTLTPPIVELIRSRASRVGLDPSRLDFHRPGPGDDYLFYADRFDIMLDAVPYGGHTTSCEYMSMGVPVVTLRGERAAGRVSASVLTQIGLPELVADSAEQYIAVAQQLGQDIDRLAGLRSGLRQRMRSYMGEGMTLAHNLEVIYRQVWQEWCDKQGRSASRTPVPGVAVSDTGDLNQRGLELAQAGRYEEAADCFAALTRSQPDSLAGWSNLGNALKNAGRLGEAETAFGRAINLDVGDPGAVASLADLYKLQYRFMEARDCYRRVLPGLPAYHPAWDNYLLMLHYGPDWDAEFIAAEHDAWGRRVSVAAAADYPNSRQPERPLRIGYVSPDLCRHPVARFLEPVLANFDRRRFQVYLYAEVLNPDEVSRRFMTWAHAWRPTVGRPAAEVAAQVRADGIDLLVDLAGHTAHNRLDVFALRPAPVQMTYLGYPGPTGLAALGWRVTDGILDPPGGAEPSIERPVRLPMSFACFAPPAKAPEVSPAPVQRRGYVTFGAHHNLAKYNERALDLYAQVMKAVPSSRLLFFRSSYTPDVAAHLRERLARRGVDIHRIEVRQPPRAEADYLSVYADIDLILDSFPFAGHTTTCEALWQGVPVLTQAGDRIAGRLATSVLTSLGLPGLVAADAADFVERTRQLAAKPGQLSALRRELRPRLRSHLCVGAAFVPLFEEVYRKLWSDWCAHARPTGSSVS